MKSVHLQTHFDGANKIFISVIVPALNEEKVIGRCLEALSRIFCNRYTFEVIVVDNGSRDRTVETVRRFDALPFVKIISLEGVHISALRNRGAVEARGNILAFLDADCLAPPDWLTNAIRIFENCDDGIIGAHYQIPDDATWVGRVWFQDRLSQKVGAVSYVPSGDLLIRRDLFIQVGGFDESIQTNEDFELCQRVIREGWPVRAYPELQVVHLGTPRTLLGFFRKQRWHGTHVFTVFLRDPEKRRNLIPVLLSIYTLICLIGLSVGAVWGIVNAAWWITCVFASMLIVPLSAIAVFRSAPRKKWSDVLPLTILYLTFGIARASCFLKYKTWKSA